LTISASYLRVMGPNLGKPLYPLGYSSTAAWSPISANRGRGRGRGLGRGRVPDSGQIGDGDGGACHASAPSSPFPIGESPRKALLIDPVRSLVLPVFRPNTPSAPGQIGDGRPVPVPGQIGDGDGDGDRGVRAAALAPSWARATPLAAAAT
jgi:hypothetical protein